MILKNVYLLDKKTVIIITLFLYLLFLYFSFLFIYPARLTITAGSVSTKNNYRNHEVYVIGKAAIGQYFWLHLMNGSLNFYDDGFFQSGNKTVNNITFYYMSGPGFIQNSIPHKINHLVLILNGRTVDNAKKAKDWLHYLPEIKSLEKIAIILLGNERCENQWIVPYLKSNGGIIDALFIVYDTALVDNKEVFQWPLGVATYRGFPQLSLEDVKHVYSTRRYKCNFLGTVYKNSSREIINITLRSSQLSHLCYLSTRNRWVPKESEESLIEYLTVLENSDFTLNPVGQNSECYRIYEAMSLGSIPIIEDNMTPGICVSPLRLLKRFNPPFIFVKTWEDIHYFLLKDHSLGLKKIVERRQQLLQWHEDFKKNVVTYFINILNEIFFRKKYI